MKVGSLYNRVEGHFLRDTVDPKLWEPDEKMDALNETLKELCRDVPLLRDSNTPSVCKISVNVATITGTSDISFAHKNTSDTITKGSGLGIFSVGDTIEVSGTASNDGFYHVSSASATEVGVEEDVTDESNTSATVRVSNLYRLSDKITSIEDPVQLYNGTDTTDLDHLYMRELVETYPAWRTTSEDTPKFYIMDAYPRHMMLYYRPDTEYTYTVYMNVTRIPLTEMSLDKLNSEVPEIEDRYHFGLIDGALEKLYRKQDAETFYPELADRYLVRWRGRKEEIKREHIRFYNKSRVTEVDYGLL